MPVTTTEPKITSHVAGGPDGVNQQLTNGICALDPLPRMGVRLGFTEASTKPCMRPFWLIAPPVDGVLGGGGVLGRL
jgi:hypothetical protein